MSHPRPAAAVSNAQRIDDIDVVRGMALCGVLVSNLVEMFRVPWGRTYQVPGTGRIDDYVDALMGTAFQGNVIHLTFSLIFGLGMAISSERVLATGASAHRLLVRKQLILLVIGLIHATLIWNGDVLVSYALVGLAILPFLRSRTRTLLLGALVMAIIFCLPIYPVRPSPESVENTQRVARALEAYQNGTWWDVQAQGMSDLRYMWRYAVARHLFAEGMAFCLGFAVWRGGLLTAPEQHRRAMQWTLMGGAVSLIVVVLRYAGFLPSVSSSSFGSFGPAARFLWQFAYLVTNTQLAFAYCAGILLLLQRPFWRRWLLSIVPLGRTCLSNYLMQSIVFGFIFYGYGLGQYGKQRTAITALCGILFYVVQVVLSTIWLRNFRLGPVEWLWRTLYSSPSNSRPAPARAGAP